jgi:hypothetical protein
MSNNMWINYVKQYQASHPKLSYKECMERAKKPYHDLKNKQQKNKQQKNKQQKNKQQKRGGSSGIDLESPQLRFEAGVTALNSNLAGIGRPVIF